MPAHKGHEKSGGRQPGAKNQVQHDVKVALSRIVGEYVTDLEGVRKLKSDLEVMRPAERAGLIEKLLKYVLPTLGSLSVKGEDDGAPVAIKVTYKSAKPKSEADDDAETSDIDYSEDI